MAALNSNAEKLRESLSYLQRLDKAGWSNVDDPENQTESEDDESEDDESEDEAGGFAPLGTEGSAISTNFIVIKDGFHSGIKIKSGSSFDLGCALEMMKMGGFDVSTLRIIEEGVPDAPLEKDPLAHICMSDLCREFEGAVSWKYDSRISPNSSRNFEESVEFEFSFE